MIEFAAVIIACMATTDGPPSCQQVWADTFPEVDLPACEETVRSVLTAYGWADDHPAYTFAYECQEIGPAVPSSPPDLSPRRVAPATGNETAGLRS